MIRITKAAYLIVPETGESIEVPAGTNVNLPDDLKKKSTILRKKDEISVSEEWFSKKCGDFIWKMFSGKKHYYLPCKLFVEILYLVSFLDYDSNRLVVLSPRKRTMEKKDVQRFIKGYGKNFYVFWKQLIATEIIQERKDGSLYVSDEFRKGSLKSNGLIATKIFTLPLKQLYRNLTATELTYLAYIYRLIPCTNVFHNIVCQNPYEFENEKIVALNCKDICAFLGISIKNRSRTLKKMQEITFIDRNGKEKYAIKAITNKKQKQIYINPQLFSCCIAAADLIDLEEKFEVKNKNDNSR